MANQLYGEEWNSEDFQIALKMVLKLEIQALLNRLSEAGEETVVLTASKDDQLTGHMASTNALKFVTSNDVNLLKNKFLTYLLAASKVQGQAVHIQGKAAQMGPGGNIQVVQAGNKGQVVTTPQKNIAKRQIEPTPNIQQNQLPDPKRRKVDLPGPQAQQTKPGPQVSQQMPLTTSAKMNQAQPVAGKLQQQATLVRAQSKSELTLKTTKVVSKSGGFTEERISDAEFRKILQQCSPQYPDGEGDEEGENEPQVPFARSQQQKPSGQMNPPLTTGGPATLQSGNKTLAQVSRLQAASPKPVLSQPAKNDFSAGKSVIDLKKDSASYLPSSSDPLKLKADGKVSPVPGSDVGKGGKVIQDKSRPGVIKQNENQSGKQNTSAKPKTDLDNLEDIDSFDTETLVRMTKAKYQQNISEDEKQIHDKLKQISSKLSWVVDYPQKSSSKDQTVNRPALQMQQMHALGQSSIAQTQGKFQGNAKTTLQSQMPQPRMGSGSGNPQSMLASSQMGAGQMSPNQMTSSNMDMMEMMHGAEGEEDEHLEDYDDEEDDEESPDLDQIDMSELDEEDRAALMKMREARMQKLAQIDHHMQDYQAGEQLGSFQGGQHGRLMEGGVEGYGDEGEEDGEGYEEGDYEEEEQYGGEEGQMGEMGEYSEYGEYEEGQEGSYEEMEDNGVPYGDDSGMGLSQGQFQGQAPMPQLSQMQPQSMGNFLVMNTLMLKCLICNKIVRKGDAEQHEETHYQNFQEEEEGEEEEGPEEGEEGEMGEECEEGPQEGDYEKFPPEVPQGEEYEQYEGEEEGNYEEDGEEYSEAVKYTAEPLVAEPLVAEKIATDEQGEGAKQVGDGADSLQVPTCDICNKTFKTKNNLDRHKRLHTAAKDISCPLCDKTFKLQTYLTRHLRKNHKEYKESTDVDTGTEGESAQSAMSEEGSGFKCAVCMVEFSDEDALTEHMQTKHEGANG